MIGNFNITDSGWDLNFSHHSHHSNVLFEIADSFQLELSRLTEQVPTSKIQTQLSTLCSQGQTFWNTKIIPSTPTRG